MKYLILCLCIAMLTSCKSTTYQYENYCNSPDNEECNNINSSKNIAVFFDGTGNTPSDNTNVYKLYRLVSSNEISAMPSMYIEGVGTEDGRSVSGSVLGKGFKPRLIESYKFLLHQYKSNDNSLYLFGFSRGAYNARVLAGLLYSAGLADISGLTNERVNLLAKEIITAYLKKGTLDEKKEFIRSVNGYKKSKIEPIVKFLGVWDSVSALSLKRNNEHLLGTVSKIYIDQVCNIEQVAHAISSDDNRARSFTPELMTTPALLAYCDLDGEPIDGKVAGQYLGSRVDEVWFAGAHSDVGGGYKDEEVESLSGVSLNWMLRKLAKLDNPIIPTNTQVPENPLAESHIGEDSILSGRLYRNRNREIVKYMNTIVHPDLNTIKVHSSLLFRLEKIPRTLREFNWAGVYDEKDHNYPDNFKQCFKVVPLKDLNTYNNRKVDFTLSYEPSRNAKCFDVIEPDLY